MDLGICLVSPASSGYQAFLFRAVPCSRIRPGCSCVVKLLFAISLRLAGRHNHPGRHPPDGPGFLLSLVEFFICQTGNDHTCPAFYCAPIQLANWNR